MAINISRKLAECLLRRKELNHKIDRMKTIREQDLFKMRIQRVPVGSGTDMEELRAAVPKMSFAEFDAEFNLYAMQLRLIDGAIQQANWTMDIPEVDNCFKDYVRPETTDE